MPETDTRAVEVTQEDIDLEFEIFQSMLHGLHDPGSLSARHRLASQTQSAARVEALEKALRPFADAAADLDERRKDHHDIWEAPEAMGITVGDLRIAHLALQTEGAAS